MKNNGQALITFIIFLPIIIIILGSVIEVSIINYSKHKLISLTKSIIASTIESKNKNDIILLYNKNNIDTDFDIIYDDGIEIIFNYEINSFLGKIINKDYYNIYIDIKGKKYNNQIIYEKG